MCNLWLWPVHLECNHPQHLAASLVPAPKSTLASNNTASTGVDIYQNEDDKSAPHGNLSTNPQTHAVLVELTSPCLSMESRHPLM